MTSFATGFLVAFLEWTCVELIHPYLDNDKSFHSAQRLIFLTITNSGRLTVKKHITLTEKKIID